MKLQEHDYGFEAVLPSNRTPFKIKTSAKLFDILSSGIYKDKILAVIRELSCNAYDAHVVAGKKNVPFKIKMPTSLDPTFYVEDEGTGIDPTRITDIYWTYGESTKTDSNEQIGALGLGSKSPFAYTKSSFIVKNRYQGVEYTYLCFINEDGMPDGSLLDEQPCGNTSGITVEFAVRTEDVSAFYNRTDRFFKRWGAVKPQFVDRKVDEILVSKITRVIEGTDWYLEKTDHNVYSDHAGAVAVQGNVPYPIEIGSIPKLPAELAIIASNPFVITYQLGEINFTSSRESLEYDERTCINIISRLQEISDELKASFSKKIFKSGMTQLEFITNFKNTFVEFQLSVKNNVIHQTNRIFVDSDSAYLYLLLGLSKKDTVLYDGHHYEISDLLSCEVTLHVKKYQSFGLYRPARRGRKSRVHIRKIGNLLFYPLENIPGNLIHSTWSAHTTLKIGDPLRFEWNAPIQPKNDGRPSNNGSFYRALTMLDKFDVETTYDLPIESKDITFYVNDTGSSGESRYRALVDHKSIFTNSFYITFNAKLHKAEDIIAELEELIQSGIKGAKVKRLSTEPDYRAVVEKAKIETGSVRLRTRTLIYKSRMTSNNVPSLNVSVQLKEVDRILTAEKVFKLDELQAMPVVPYIIKHRSPTKLFDEENRETIIGCNIFTAIASHFLLTDLMVPLPVRGVNVDSLPMLILNEGQVNWLKSKKVAVVGLKALITQRIKALDEVEHFTATVERVMALKRVKLVYELHASISNFDDKSLLSRMLDVSHPSAIKELFAEYTSIVGTEVLMSEQYAKNYILAEVGYVGNQASSIAHQIESTLKLKYRMLKLLSNIRYLPEEDMAEVVDYIEEIDA